VDGEGVEDEDAEGAEVRAALEADAAALGTPLDASGADGDVTAPADALGRATGVCAAAKETKTRTEQQPRKRNGLRSFIREPHKMRTKSHPFLRVSQHSFRAPAQKWP